MKIKCSRTYPINYRQVFTVKEIIWQVFIVILFGIAISMIFHDLANAEEITIYDKDHNVKTRIQNERILDKDYNTRGYIKDNRILDKDYNVKGYIKSEKEK